MQVAAAAETPDEADFRLLYIKRTPQITNPAHTHRDADARLWRSAMSSPSATSNPLSTLAPKRKTKKKHFVQQKVEVFRASDPVLSVLMWGVNHSVGTCAASWLSLSLSIGLWMRSLTVRSLIMRRLMTWARCLYLWCCFQTTSNPAPRSKWTTTSSTSTVLLWRNLQAASCDLHRSLLLLWFFLPACAYQKLQTPLENSKAFLLQQYLSKLPQPQLLPLTTSVKAAREIKEIMIWLLCSVLRCECDL